MNREVFKSSNVLLIFSLALTVLYSGCVQMSEIIYDQTAGMNGGFEVVQEGLPVNWLVYTPNTIPTGEYDLIIDTTRYKDGKQSLHFRVRECSPNGGWSSPGLCQEYYAIPGETYKFSCWILNNGCDFFLQIGGVSAFDGKYDTIIKSNEKIDTWQHFAYQYQMPAEDKFNRIRFELNVLSPGRFWIDNIRIEDMDGNIVIPASE